MFTTEERQQMDQEHYNKYEGAARALGVAGLKQTVLCVASAEEIRRALTADKNLNNIPLGKWDNMHESVRHSMRNCSRAAWLKHAYTLFKGYGDPEILSGKMRVWSLSDTVCTLKHVARYYIAEATPPCEYVAPGLAVTKGA